MFVGHFALGFAAKRAAPRVSVAVLFAAAQLADDWITHGPDLPLYPGGPEIGLGLWNSVPATLMVELAMFAVGVFLYARSTRPRDAVGRWSFGTFVAFLVVV